ncbi:MAG: RHS repeat-associated core domain-containing protein, partial [Planctomycetes bacterium]|nr:RHS repeat-associated core domain-containing protein [Planctomycetota bacterium]
GPGGALIARRADGLVVYAPAGEGRWLSVVGEVEPLVATPAGYEGHDAAGRLLRFDHEGRVVEVRPGFRVERAPGLVRLVGDAATLTLTLDDQGRAARASGPGVELTYAYDARGELVAVEGTRTARYAVEDGFVVEARGLRLTHDEDGRLARLAGPDGERVYAFAEGLAQVTTPRGTWRYALEASGAPGHAGWRVDTPWGVERGRLDARLRLVVDEVPPAEVRSAMILSSGVPSAEIPPAEVPPGVRLGPGGLVEAATTAAGRRWTFEHDARGDLVAEVGPAGRVELARDARGRRVGRRDAAGLEVTAIRDARGLVEELVAADGAALRFVHDAAGRLVSAGGDADPVGLAWDDAGRLVEQATPGVRLRYEHGPGLERVQTPWGPFVRAREAEGRVERLDTPAGAFRFEHDAAGRRTAVVYPNGVVTRLERDAAGRVAALEARGPAGDVLSLAHARGARGEVTATTRDGATTRFGHDAAGRLTSARGRDLDRAWTLDADGNRLADRDGARARAWRLDAQGKALAAGDERLEHDRAGRLVRRVGPDGETRYGWDGFGRLVEVTRVDRAGDYTARYAYDGLGRVVTRTTDAGTTRYVHERGQRLAELGPGDRVRLWVHGPRTDEPLAYLDVEGGVVGDWVFLHADAQGTVLAYSDEDGALVDRAALDPFGDLLEAPLDPARPVLFAGREVDPATDLVDLRARFYAPGLGRFLDADPVGVRGGPAPWVYADHRPLERRDPLGLWPWRDADEEALGRAPRPSALERARARLTGWLLGASLDGARLLEATAEVLDAGQTALRDARLQLVRSGAVAPRGRSGPYGSESVAANFFRDTVAPLGLELLELAEAPLAMGRELVSLRGDAEAVARAFGEGYRDAALGYGKAFDAWQAKHERRAELLLDDGHSLGGAAFNVIAAAGLEVVVPGVSAWEAGTGRDFSAFVDEGQARRLSPLERGVRAVEVVADLASAGVSARATRAARASEALGDVADGAPGPCRPRAPGPRAPAPRDDLDETSTATPRARRPRPDAPAARRAAAGGPARGRGPRRRARRGRLLPRRHPRPRPGRPGGDRGPPRGRPRPLARRAHRRARAAPDRAPLPRAHRPRRPRRRRRGGRRARRRADPAQHRRAPLPRARRGLGARRDPPRRRPPRRRRRRAPRRRRPRGAGGGGGPLQRRGGGLAHLLRRRARGRARGVGAQHLLERLPEGNQGALLVARGGRSSVPCDPGERGEHPVRNPQQLDRQAQQAGWRRSLRRPQQPP